SNKEEPSAGDWNTIKFNGTEKSTLMGCFIAYARDGIFVENGIVEIENSTIKLCSQNGINGKNSWLTVQDSIIMENSGNGVCITGNGQATIQRNTIMANGNGILLTGNETSGVNISQNKISANTQNGIRIDANYHNNIIIVDNNVSSNDRGFYISSQTSTYVTKNSISYNNIGMFYDQGNHTAYYNDIYNNEMGMNVESDATVNAEYNYWGDPSGPYHESLNPTGKGNPVGGNGVNLDFVFFLTKPMGYINVRPIAKLLTDKILVPPNEIVMFFATNSFDEGNIDWYCFNFGDGSTSGWTTLSIFTHKYSSLGTYNAAVTVMDDFGAVSSDTVTINVKEGLLPLNVNLDVSEYVVCEGEQVSITVYVTSGIVALENVTVTVFSLKGGNFTQSSGLTNATGYFVTTFTAPDVTQITNVRIVARASKSGYADCSGHEYLEVLPFLSVEILVNPDVIKSEGAAEVAVYVKSNEQPIADAIVEITSDSGSLSATTGTTYSNGAVSFVFTAPQTTIPLNVNITATATKSGYMDGEGRTTVTVNPRTFNVQMEVSALTVESGETATVTVHVREEDATPVAGALVKMSSSAGDFSVMTKTTDSTGSCTFVFNAPQTTVQLPIVITANVTKSGYTSGENQTTITVTPETTTETQGGWPITTILLIVIPIAILVVVVVLVKLKIITVSAEEE
ncbi:MAG: right-handed parallel beta-helix repeat-containing protein, partial [Candidatus Bathyarchaeales archaeon]